ncbi:MAG TPA: Ada metal-binding domain-containing protein [Bradyrhizobium sp.]|nr:Ada metal-binding domain-containing protein [Bradyrhizobium sp.]
MMDMDRMACYRAISTRDARFDGRLFVGVKTTGIYCRPICPARTPKYENVSFFASAVEAQEAGDALLARAEAWRPWRAYAALHLWAAGAPPAAVSEDKADARKAA